MGKLKRAILLNFRTKVIVPVVAVMVLLMVISMGLVNRRVTVQLQNDAAQQLATAEAVLKRTQTARANELFLRFRNVANEPRFKGVAGLSDANTYRRLLDDLIKEDVADVIAITTEGGRNLTRTRDPRLQVERFEKSCAEAIRQALQGQPKVDTIKNGERLFDIVAIPVVVNDGIVGAVTFGAENSIASEFNELTHSELILLSDGQVVASTLRPAELEQLPAALLARSGADPAKNQVKGPEEVALKAEHYLALRGRLSVPGDPHDLGYVILSSYEMPLQVLASTQRVIWLISSLAILLGAAGIWLLVRKVTEPLQELRDSVEALGQGDLSRRIEVSSMDECGELAQVFNQMAENIKGSREQLEATVETLKTTQAQLIQSEKLSGIGEFVAGVAHELNNPLTSVMGFSELLQNGAVDAQQKRHLEMIHKSALRCQKIVQSLLSFSRRHQPEQKLVCVNRLVEGAVEILAYQMRTSNIEVVTELDPHLPQAMVDPHQLQQVFVNIINNARQAIEGHRPKGCVRVTTETCDTNIRATFKDNGPGIREENLSRVFDPFFTTKELGKGTGLGLSLCYGIVKEHGGTIKVQSNYGEGAAFIIELPIVIGASAAIEKTEPLVAALPDAREGAGKKVLVIDDEEPILQMVSEALGRCGYEVDVASDGETALQRLTHASYDLTLCDWKMPGLNGQQIYNRALVLNPASSQRMIFITGDVINDRAQRFLKEQNKVCLAKPFSLSEFRNAINTVLAGS